MATPRILIADDQNHVLEALQLLLKNEGFVSETVSSPRAVVEAVQERIRRNGQVVRLSDGGTVLGIFPDASYEERQIALKPGDRLVLLTDGITEADNAGGEEFGEDRLTHLLVENRRLPASELKRVLLDAVASFVAHGFQDDATLVILSMV
jgi:sigma-B regulation protein RsbU (phosphoserine phosphatase)